MNDPNGSEKNEFPLKNGKIPCLHLTLSVLRAIQAALTSGDLSNHSSAMCMD